MGLDITWYKGLAMAVGNEAFDDRGGLLDDEFVTFYVNPEFPGRADDIEHRKAYRYGPAESYGGFCAGSYVGYSQWREELAKLAGYPAKPSLQVALEHSEGAWSVTEGPFWELINFSDCEGVIGAAVSAKLARDFAEFQDKADAHPDERFRKKYAEWRNAFEQAADSGAVKFR
jgi:hypothetical protein